MRFTTMEKLTGTDQAFKWFAVDINLSRVGLEQAHRNFTGYQIDSWVSGKSGSAKWYVVARTLREGIGKSEENKDLKAGGEGAERLRRGKRKSIRGDVNLGG